MSKQRIAIAFLTILLALLWIAPVQAQSGGWSEPYRLSEDRRMSSEGYLVADQYGYVHCFWIETLPQNGGSFIKYARFDGTTWTKPNDIYRTKEEIKNVSPFVDKQGILHIAWSEGLYRVSVFYSYAPANDTLSAQNWAKPIQIHVPARPVYLRVDSKGVLHILYINETEESGVFYIRSEDKGLTWSEPVWLDPDIQPGYVPDSLNFELDEKDGLHAVWFYGAIERTGRPNWVRYTHSLDGGHSWSPPVTLDQLVEENNHFLDAASPKMIIQGETVHVIWAAGQQPYRFHSYSTDGGQTWSAPVQIFGQLQGQAFDGLAVDRAGRVHFFGQIRYPMGIYHAVWDHNRWSKPELVYLIAPQGSEDNLGNRVHAHFTLPVVRAGNQLVLTFTDGPADPNRRLFVMYRTLDDILPIDNLPTPTPRADLIPVSGPMSSEPTVMPSPTATVPSLTSIEAQPVGQATAPDLAIQVALAPTLLVLGVTMVFQLLSKRKH